MAGPQPIAGIPSEKRARDTAHGRTNSFAPRSRIWENCGLEVTGTTLKVRAVDALKAQFPLAHLLPIADLPGSTFCDHRNRLRRSDRHAELKEAIRETFEDAKGAYWHRRILAVLRWQGRRVSKKTVLTLMRALGLQCLVRRRKRCNPVRGELARQPRTC
ncbi:IS3 family transposase [Rhodococcus erythropolis]|uniref:IS3 family transposase n=1 Tax=Rhodococcus erythropolis TaxID=1833 RepID=UPI003981ED77